MFNRDRDSELRKTGIFIGMTWWREISPRHSTQSWTWSEQCFNISWQHRHHWLEYKPEFIAVIACSCMAFRQDGVADPPRPLLLHVSRASATSIRWSVYAERMLKKPQSVCSTASSNSAAALPELFFPSGCEVPKLDLHTSQHLLFLRVELIFVRCLFVPWLFNIPCMYFRGIQAIFHYFIMMIKYIASSFIAFRFSSLAKFWDYRGKMVWKGSTGSQLFPYFALSKNQTSHTGASCLSCCAAHYKIRTPEMTRWILRILHDLSIHRQ